MTKTPEQGVATKEARQGMSHLDYDYIIVGAGSAGCVLANRLSADGSSVLLLEAGGSDFNPLIHIPLGMGKMHEYGMHDWGFHTEPEPNLNNRQIEAARGKVLGGSSSINVMAYTRGHRGDYDRWDREGAKGWSYKDVLPYFKKAETWIDGANTWRGGEGPLGTEWARTKDPLFDAWLEAGQAAGFPMTDDYNGKNGEGFGRGQYTIRNGRRASTSNAYLKPARARRNLTVETRAHAHRIILDGKTARGIEYEHHGMIVRAHARREVILASGTFKTPHLLMLSGIGPAEELRRHGIGIVENLPVGHNLQDHLAVLIMWHRLHDGPFRHSMRFDRMALSMLQAYFFGAGAGTVVPGGLHAFVKTQAGIDVPDIEFMFRGLPTDAHLWFPLLRPGYKDGYGIRPALLHPKSRGTIKLGSTDPNEPMRIHYNFLSHPDDLPLLRNGFKHARDVGNQKPLDSYRGEERTPGPKVKTDAEIDAYIRRTAVTAHHPAGTCKMGEGEDCVVDSQMKVRGISGLRIVDASAMPDMVGAHINAAVIMMAEKASDMILGKPALPAAEGA